MVSWDTKGVSALFVLPIDFQPDFATQMTPRSAAIDSVVPANAEHQVSSEATTTYQIVLIRPSELCGKIARRWKEIREHSTEYSSPYFDIEFTKAVSRVRDDIEIAIAVDEEECIQAFFPFQRVARRRAVPVGGRLSDLHGPMASDDVGDGLIKQIMKSAKLKSYAFHAGIKTETDSANHEFEVLDSYFMDLSNGWDTYFGWARNNSCLLYTSPSPRDRG